MEGKPSTPCGTERDRESYLRWQELALTQLGYTMNLMLTLAGASLAFAAKTMMESKSILPFPSRFFFHASVVAFAVSVFVAVAANVTRAYDFRCTRRAARERMKDGEDHQDLHDRAEAFGTCTWIFFDIQATAFAIGATAFALSMWCSYGNRI